MTRGRRKLGTTPVDREPCRVYTDGLTCPFLRSTRSKFNTETVADLHTLTRLEKLGDPESQGYTF